MKLELRKTFQFEAAHLLPKLPKAHKCRRLHGHSFQVEIVVTGECDPAIGNQEHVPSAESGRLFAQPGNRAGAEDDARSRVVVEGRRQIVVRLPRGF